MKGCLSWLLWKQREKFGCRKVGVDPANRRHRLGKVDRKREKGNLGEYLYCVVTFDSTGGPSSLSEKHTECLLRLFTCSMEELQYLSTSSPSLPIVWELSPETWKSNSLLYVLQFPNNKHFINTLKDQGCRSKIFKNSSK